MKKKNLLYHTLLIFFGLIINIKTHAQIVYVDSANVSGIHNGTSWATAYNDFQAGINAASGGDTIWVAKGTYQPANNNSFSMKNGVVIYGGFADTATKITSRNWVINTTILMGNNNSVISDNNINSSSVIDGFTITNGSSNNGGGGMSNYSSNPSIKNIIFSNNSVMYFMGTPGGGGAGIYDNNSSPILTNVTFSNNSVVGDNDGGGGAMYNDNNSDPVITDVTFSGNSVQYGNGGGAIYNNNSNPILTNVTFSANYDDQSSGGAVYNNNSNPVFTNVVFYNNQNLEGGGAGGAIYNNNSSPTFSDVTFSGNFIVDGSGGAVCNDNNSNPIFTNTVFSHNSASFSSGGGAMYNSTNSSPTITNVTFFDNSAPQGGGGAIYDLSPSLVVTNCVFWGNTGNSGVSDDISASPFAITYSFTQSYFAGTGNIQGVVDPFINDADPIGTDGIFMTADDGLELTGCTPALNAGNNAADTTTTDITGQPRVFDSTIDMGAYEYQSLPDGLSLALNKDTATKAIFPGVNALIVNNTCRIIAQLLPDSANPVADNVKSEVWIDSTVKEYNGQPYVQRHYDISPTTGAAIATAKITLFFTQAEFDSFNVVSSVKLPVNSGDAAGIANLRVIQFHGTSATGVPGTYSGSTITIDPVDSDIVWNSTLNRWQVTFDVTGFSGFIVTATGAIALPLNLLSFTGQLTNGNTLLQWETAAELNTGYFEVEKSVDDINFNFLAKVTAAGTGSHTYTTVDEQPQNGNNYYRLKSVDNDGSFTYSNIVLIQVGNNKNSLLVIYPNPTSEQLIVKYNNASSNAMLTVYNLNGQKVLTTPMNGLQKSIDVSSFVAGTYIIEYSSSSDIFRSKFVKIN